MTSSSATSTIRGRSPHFMTEMKQLKITDSTVYRGVTFVSVVDHLVCQFTVETDGSPSVRSSGASLQQLGAGQDTEVTA